MGVLTIETNQTINLSQYGLKAGDLITVTCIGGGAGGAAGGSVYSNDSDYMVKNGSAGGDAGHPGKGGNISYAGGGGGAGGGYGAGGGGGAGYSGIGAGGSGGGAGEVKIMSCLLNETTVNSLSATIGAAGLGGNFTGSGAYRTAGTSTLAKNPPTNGGVTSLGTICSANGGVVYRGGPGSTVYAGGGGAGGYLFPQKIYGGPGGTGGYHIAIHEIYGTNGGAAIESVDKKRDMLKGSGGGGGEAGPGNYVSYSNLFARQAAQESEFGGAGGAAGQTGGYGTMSKGHGAIIILWD